MIALKIFIFGISINIMFRLKRETMIPAKRNNISEKSISNIRKVNFFII